MQDKYLPEQVESQAQAHWRAIDAERTTENDARFPKGKFYACSMLPYPSGKLHMGHVRNYTINDVMLRHMRMRGYNVLMPMGWDAFGLPAENAAIDRKVAPAAWTYANIADMKSQMEPLGFAFDWSRELATCRPDYYRWNQWLFLRMLKAGIAYRKTQLVNWDPVDQTVLANEQVIEGRGWRSGALIERREIPGYYLGITQYADELLDELKNLDGWPSQVRAMQENWIGRSTGLNFGFPYQLNGQSAQLKVYTTRADTIMGASFVAIAAEHPLAAQLSHNQPALQAFIEECRKGAVAEAELATLEKRGMATGFHVQHPITGADVPVWIGNYVLSTYGEGAVMGVPAHDERDFAFANKYGLPIHQVIHVEGKTFSTETWQDWYGDKNVGVCINSGKYNGLGYQAAIDAIASDLEAAQLGTRQTQFRLRDWGISRQRYWGTPIPIIHCDSCGPVPVPEADLPVVLPEDLIPDGSGNPLNKSEAFLRCHCPSCGKPARRETDTMDTFVDSSWYFMRYCSPGSNDAMVDERCRYWMPMDQYIGGIEHAVLHLLYARFWTKVMRDLGVIDFGEPFTRLFTQGMLLNDSFYREEDGGRKRWFYPSEVQLQTDERGRITGALAREDGLPVALGGIEKMSKSKNNVVEPRDIIARFGADTARAFVMFAGPPDQSAAWSDAGAEGTHRFLKRLWSFAFGVRATLSQEATAASLADARYELHKLMGQINFDYERLQYNTVVSGTMKMLNLLESAAKDPHSGGFLHEGLSILLRALYPVAPHICQQLWQELAFSKSIGELAYAPWPEPDPQALQRQRLALVVQVNGKLRGNVTVPVDAKADEVVAAVMADADLARFVTGPTKKVILVPGKLINLVV